MKLVRGDVEGCLWTENSLNFNFKTSPKRKTPVPFARHGAFFTQFLSEPLTLLLIGGPLLGRRHRRKRCMTMYLLDGFCARACWINRDARFQEVASNCSNVPRFVFECS